MARGLPNLLLGWRHRDLRRLLDAYLDGALVDEEAAELAAHLLRCAECRRDAAVTERVKEVLARLDLGAPPSLAARRLRHFAGSIADRD